MSAIVCAVCEKKNCINRAKKKKKILHAYIN